MSDARFRFLRQESARLERQRAALRELDPRRAPEVRVIEAADFVTGREADFARAANTRGIVVSSWRADEGETRAEFLARAKQGAKALGAARLVVGGVPDLADQPAVSSAIRPAPRGAIAMPDGALHAGQIEALRVIQANRFAALRAGRRFGKTSLAAALAADTAMLGGTAGLFAPIYKLAAPLFDILARVLAPLLATSNRSIGELRLEGGGGVDIWNLEHSAWAGRGRSYNRVIIDEAAFAGPHLITAWSAQIRPTMADVQGSAIVASTPAGSRRTISFGVYVTNCLTVSRSSSRRRSAIRSFRAKRSRRCGRSITRWYSRKNSKRSLSI
jgi:hypothetical protein